MDKLNRIGVATSIVLLSGLMIAFQVACICLQNLSCNSNSISHSSFTQTLPMPDETRQREENKIATFVLHPTNR